MASANGNVLRRKFLALELPNPDAFDPQEDGAFRNLVVTLEDTKIRSYKIEERAKLRDVNHADWIQHFQTYLEHIECPHTALQWQSSPEDRFRLVDWLLGYAISLEYHDKKDTYNGVGGKAAQAADVVAAIDLGTPETHTRLRQLADLLHLPAMDDVNLLWRAVAKTIRDRFQPSVVTEARTLRAQGLQTEARSLESIPLGFSTHDPAVDKAASVLRLLHLAELRGLQTQVNELIVAVQNITADPKTDSRLGKVGR